jgi:hypothetical protein
MSTGTYYAYSVQIIINFYKIGGLGQQKFILSQI